MKKKEKYYALNNQEDEDGYSLYPGKEMSNENIKEKQEAHSPNTRVHTGSGAVKLRVSPIYSFPFGAVNETR